MAQLENKREFRMSLTEESIPKKFKQFSVDDELECCSIEPIMVSRNVKVTSKILNRKAGGQDVVHSVELENGVGSILMDGHGDNSKNGFSKWVEKSENVIPLLNEAVVEILSLQDYSKGYDRIFQNFVDKINSNYDSFHTGGISGSTMVFVVVKNNGYIFCSSLGDSGIRIIENGNLYWANIEDKFKLNYTSEEILSFEESYKVGGSRPKEKGLGEANISRMVLHNGVRAYKIYTEKDTIYSGYAQWNSGRSLAMTKGLGHGEIRKTDVEFSKVNSYCFYVSPLSKLRIIMFSDGVSDMFPKDFESEIYDLSSDEICKKSFELWGTNFDVYMDDRKCGKSSMGNPKNSDHMGRDDISCVVIEDNTESTESYDDSHSSFECIDVVKSDIEVTETIFDKTIDKNNSGDN